MLAHQSQTVSRRKFLGMAGASTLLSVASTSIFSKALSTTHQVPNVLFISADDMGWGDLSIYGQTNYQTPNLDTLARQGVRFVNGYASSTVCTPTRVAFLTGRYPGRTAIGLQEPLLSATEVGDAVGLSPDHPTIASLLKGKGYDTALVGKWHCGYLPTYSPIFSGFNEFFGIYSGSVDYFRHVDNNGKPDLFANTTPTQRTGYLTDLLTEYAVDFIKRPRNNPFFLNLQYTAPHWPWQGPNDLAVSQRLQGRDSYISWYLINGFPRTYAEMMQSMDRGIGRVLQALEETGLASNTIVIFTSDNGGEWLSSNGPFRGQKGLLLEGGIRAPILIRWPGKIAANQVTQQLASTVDLTATILNATGTSANPNYPLDGINLLPFIQNQNFNNSRTLFWRYTNNTQGQASPALELVPDQLQGAARRENWKYLLNGEEEFLYNLARDPRERINLKDIEPEMFNLLRNSYQQWQAQLLPYPSN